MKKGILDSVVRVRAETVTSAQFEYWKRRYTIVTDEGPFEMFRIQEDAVLGDGHPQPALILPRSAVEVYGNDLVDRRTWGEPMTKLVRRIWKPRKGQEEAVRALLEQFKEYEINTHLLRGGTLVSPCGSGKALANGEPVLTPDGWRSIENLREGDLVVGQDGKAYPVRGVFPQGERELFEIKFTDGTKIYCDEDHLWKVNLNRDGGISKVMTTGQMKAAGLRGSSGRRFFMPMPEPVRGSEVELPLDAYTLGALLGDGHLSICGRVLFTTADSAILDQMVLPEKTRPKALRGQNSGKATTYLLAPPRGTPKSFARLYEILAGFGLMGCTSHSKFIPGDYLLADSSSRLALLQGLMDTDGCAECSGAAEFSTTSLDLITGVQYLVCSLGGTATFSERETSLCGNKFKSYRSRIKLPKGVRTFRLERKQSKMEGPRQREPYRAIHSIEKIGRGKATCISVDSPDHLFLTRNCVPTHNTVMGAELAIRLGRKTAVLVHKEFLAKQWEAAFRMLAPNISIGRVRRAECTFRDKDVVIIMCQSLVGKTTKQEYPKEMFNSFGLVICDEVHRYAAEVWQEAIVLFPAMARLGLTATYRRRDGLIEVIDHHIGGIAHEVETDTLPVRVHTVSLSTTIEPRHYRFRWNGELNRGGLISAVAGNEKRSRVIAETIMKALEAQRKVLVLSERRKHLVELAMLCQERGLPENFIGFFVGGKKEEALDEAAERQLILATYAMAREGLDIPSVDTLIMATPVVDIQQSVGRIIRPLGGKKEPVVIDYVDAKVPPCAGFASARRKMYRELGYDVQ